MKKQRLMILMFLLLMLAACGGQETAVEPASGNAPIDFTNAELPIGAQLAIGTLMLEDTAVPVTAAQAETMLPLWQALQSLSATGTAADVELEAVVKQIQGELTAEQQTALNEMDISAESLQALAQSGVIQPRGFGGGDGGAQGGGFGRPAGGGFGRPPSGGVGGEGRVDPSLIETRQAQGGGQGAGFARFASVAVIQLLETKLGIEQESLPFNPRQLVQIVAQELEMQIPDLLATVQEGQTVSEVIEANGGDVEAVRAAMLEALTAVTLPEDTNAEMIVEEYLNNPMQLGFERGSEG